jgi:hypothetical protein
LQEEARAVAQAPDPDSDSRRGFGAVDRTSTGPRAVVAQVADAPAPSRRRGVTWLLAAVALAAGAGVAFIELRHSKLVVADGTFSLVPRSAPTLPPPSADDSTPEESSDKEEAVEGPRLAQEEDSEAAVPNSGRGASRLASATAPEKKPTPRATAKPSASTYALTPAPKASSARARKQPPPPPPARAAAAPPPAASTAEAKKKEECREPYWFDNRGIKRLRLDCL